VNAMGGIASATPPTLQQEVESAERVEAWFAAARAGAQFVYARGASLPKQAPGALAVRKLLDQGLVITFQRKLAPFRYEYVAQRRAEPARRRTGAAIRLLEVGRAEINDECGDLLAELKRRGRHGETCGTNRELGEALGGLSPDRVSYLFKKLQKAERISVNSSGDERVVTIAGTGLKTADSGQGVAR
jgi:hypothetical protein